MFVSVSRSPCHSLDCTGFAADASPLCKLCQNSSSVAASAPVSGVDGHQAKNFLTVLISSLTYGCSERNGCL